MDFLVTGGCGFIGSNFIKYLLNQRADARVINLDNLTYAGSPSNTAGVEAIHGGTRYFFVQGDICDPHLVNSLLEGSYSGASSHPFNLIPNIVVNFAAETHVDRSINDSAPFIRTNISGTHVLLEAAQQQWSKNPASTLDSRRIFLQISTDEVYGSLGEEGCFTEDSALAPNSPYAASKAGADLLASSYHRTYGLPLIITRSSNNYGPHQFPEKFIPLMISCALSDNPMPVYGDGRNIRDWLHVEDHCAAILCVLENGTPGEIYNIGADMERRNVEVVERILDFLDKPKSLVSFVRDRLGHDWRYALDSSRIRALGWEPGHDFEEGLKQTVAWYVENPDWWKVPSGSTL